MPESGVFYIVILTAVGLLIRNQGGIDMASTACIFLSRKILESIFLSNSSLDFLRLSLVENCWKLFLFQPSVWIWIRCQSVGLIEYGLEYIRNVACWLRRKNIQWSRLLEKRRFFSTNNALFSLFSYEITKIVKIYHSQPLPMMGVSKRWNSQWCQNF